MPGEPTKISSSNMQGMHVTENQPNKNVPEASRDRLQIGENRHRGGTAQTQPPDASLPARLTAEKLKRLFESLGDGSNKPKKHQGVSSPARDTITAKGPQEALPDKSNRRSAAAPRDQANQSGLTQEALRAHDQLNLQRAAVTQNDETGSTISAITSPADPLIQISQELARAVTAVNLGDLSANSEERDKLLANLPTYATRKESDWKPLQVQEGGVVSSLARMVMGTTGSQTRLDTAEDKAKTAGNILHYPERQSELTEGTFFSELKKEERTPVLEPLRNAFTTIESVHSEIKQLNVVLMRAQNYLAALKNIEEEIKNDGVPIGDAKKANLAAEIERTVKEINNIEVYITFENNQTTAREAFLAQSRGFKDTFGLAVRNQIDRQRKISTADPVESTYRSFLKNPESHNFLEPFISAATDLDPSDPLKTQESRLAVIASMEKAISIEQDARKIQQLSQASEIEDLLRTVLIDYQFSKTQDETREQLHQLLAEKFPGNWDLDGLKNLTNFINDLVKLRKLESLIPHSREKLPEMPKESLALIEIVRSEAFKDIAKQAEETKRLERLQRSLQAIKLESLKTLREKHLDKLKETQKEFDTVIVQVNKQITSLANQRKHVQLLLDGSNRITDFVGAKEHQRELEDINRKIQLLDMDYRLLVQSLQLEYAGRLELIKPISTQIHAISTRLTIQDSLTLDPFNLQFTRLEREHQLALNGMNDISEARDILLKKTGFGDIFQVLNNLVQTFKTHGVAEFNAKLQEISNKIIAPVAVPISQKMQNEGGVATVWDLTRKLVLWANRNPRVAGRLASSVEHTLRVAAGDDPLTIAWKVGSVKAMVRDTFQGERREIAGALETEPMPPELIALLSLMESAPTALETVRGAFGQGSGSGAAFFLAAGITTLMGVPFVIAGAAGVTAGAAVGYQRATISQGISERVQEHPTTEESVNSLLEGMSYDVTLLQQASLTAQSLGSREAVKAVGTTLNDIREQDGWFGALKTRATEFKIWWKKATWPEIRHRLLWENAPIAVTAAAGAVATVGGAIATAATGGLFPVAVAVVGGLVLAAVAVYNVFSFIRQPARVLGDSMYAQVKEEVATELAKERLGWIQEQMSQKRKNLYLRSLLNSLEKEAEFLALPKNKQVLWLQDLVGETPITDQEERIQKFTQQRPISVLLSKDSNDAWKKHAEELERALKLNAQATPA